MVYFNILPAEHYRCRVENLTLTCATILLRNLGNFDLDALQVTSWAVDTFSTTPEVLARTRAAMRVGDLSNTLVQFNGGPAQAQVFTGDYTLFILDRIMYMLCERGVDFVEQILAYSEGFSVCPT